MAFHDIFALQKLMNESELLEYSYWQSIGFYDILSTNRQTAKDYQFSFSLFIYTSVICRIALSQDNQRAIYDILL